MLVNDFEIGKKYLIKHAGGDQPIASPMQRTSHAFTIEVLRLVPGSMKENLYDGIKLRRARLDEVIAPDTHLRVIRQSSRHSFLIPVSAILAAVEVP